MASSREKRAEERAQTDEILGSFRMNLDKTFEKVVNKMAGVPDDASGGRSKLIDKDTTMVNGKPVENHHVDWNAYLQKLGKAPQGQSRQSSQNPYASPPNTISIALANRAMETFQPILNELSKFKFASGINRRAAQMDTLMTAVKKAMQEVAIREVANNTSQFYDNAYRFVQPEDGGLKVTYKVANVNVNVSVKGEFVGDEVICLEPPEGPNVTAYVARQNGSQFEDLTNNFAIQMEVLS